MLLLLCKNNSVVRLWHATQSHSIFTINAKASVCTVQFHPLDKNYLAYGSAGNHHFDSEEFLIYPCLLDHSIYLYDLRNPRQVLNELKGHGKTVSYVQFLSEKELLSA